MKSKRDSVSSSQYRPKPFLTILDGKPTSAGRERRSGHHPSKSIFQKSGIKFQSYANEGLKNVTARGKAGFKATARILIDLPKSIFSPKASKEPVSADKRTEAQVEAGGQIASEPKASRMEAGRMEASYLLKNIHAFAAKLGKFRPESGHARKIVLAVLIAAIVISAGAAAIIGATSFPVSPGSLILPDEESAQAALMAYLEPDSADKDALQSGALPPIPVSVNIKSYTVRNGDTVERIAKKFGLRQDTVISANNLQSASSIRPGLQLRIPNMDGVSHKVRRGESLLYLAKTYAIDMTRIVDANDLASGTINTGQSLFIPNARLSSATLRNFYGERFIWPARGRISSSFGYRANPFTGLRTYHSAIDIVVSLGT
ncbi:MAG: LysM peptidoglycan-binding domain-containing protein, partial [Candidatus Hydrogenedentales bacterium]